MNLHHHENQDATHVSRRSFLGMLATGALTLLAGGRAVDPKQVEEVIDIVYAAAWSPRYGDNANKGTAEVRWRVPGEDWQTQVFAISKAQPVAWLSKEIGIDFARLWT